MKASVRAFNSVAAFAAALLLAGCGVLSTEPYEETSVYDLGVPAPLNKQGVPVHVGRFGMIGPYKSRMVLRRPGNKLDFNDYRKWAQPPELMLSRYLKLALEPVGGESSEGLSVSGSVLVFEADETAKTVTLVATYEIKKRNGRIVVDSGRASFSTRIEKISAESIAAAMSSNAAKLADLLSRELSKAMTHL